PAVEDRLHDLLAEAVIEVAVVELQALEGQPRVLEDMAAGAAPGQGELSGLALDQIAHPDPDRQVARGAPRAGVALGLEEPRRVLAQVSGVPGLSLVAHCLCTRYGHGNSLPGSPKRRQED